MSSPIPKNDPKSASNYGSDFWDSKPTHTQPLSAQVDKFWQANQKEIIKGSELCCNATIGVSTIAATAAADGCAGKIPHAATASAVKSLVNESSIAMVGGKESSALAKSCAEGTNNLAKKTVVGGCAKFDNCGK